MRKTSGESPVLTIRVPPSVSRRLSREARRRHTTRSEVARVILERALESSADDDLAAEARRQSALASARVSDSETLEFIQDAVDVRGWR